MTQPTIPALADIGQAAQANLQAFSGAMGDAVKTLSGGKTSPFSQRNPHNEISTR